MYMLFLCYSFTYYIYHPQKWIYYWCSIPTGKASTNPHKI